MAAVIHPRAKGAIAAISIVVALTSAAHAQQRDDFYAKKPATVECVITASKKQQVPANVLLALASIEGGKNGQTVLNTNGTRDISHFQINTSTFGKELEPYGVKLEDLQWRGCYNAELAAFLLRKRLNETNGQDFWTKAANYHSRTPKYNAIYKAKLVKLSTEWADWLKQTNSAVSITYK